MNRRTFLAASATALAHAADAPPALLDPESFRHYIDDFNGAFKEEVVNFIPDARAWEFLEANIPLFTCPDREIEQLYYYRWWTYRKHIKETPDGFLVTEFLKPVKHAAEYNALSCAFGHHMAEGRWLRDRQFIDGDIHFWLRTGEDGGIRKNLHQFSGWAAAALYDRWLMDGRTRLSDLVPRSAARRLRRLGAGAPHRQRPVLAARCFRRHGKLHQRRPQGEEHPAEHQQLHVRQRQVDCRHRGDGRAQAGGRAVPRARPHACTTSSNSASGTNPPPSSKRA